MAKVNVEKWFGFENSTKAEEQAKYFVASSIESYLNGCYNDEYEPMTKDEYKEYVWKDLMMLQDTMINGNEFKHLKFFGKEQMMKLVDTYLDNYEDVKAYLK